jgi:hypothetical protein
MKEKVYTVAYPCGSTHLEIRVNHTALSYLQGSTNRMLRRRLPPPHNRIHLVLWITWGWDAPVTLWITPLHLHQFSIPLLPPYEVTAEMVVNLVTLRLLPILTHSTSIS